MGLDTTHDAFRIWRVRAKLTDYSTVTRKLEASDSRAALRKFLRRAASELTENSIAEIKHLEIEEITKEKSS